MLGSGQRYLDHLDAHCTNIVLSQTKHTAVQTFSDNFTQKVDQFIWGLPTDEEDDPILPVYGQPGYRWRPEVESAVKEEMVVCLANAAEAMVRFKMNTSVQEVELITSQALCNFLQCLALEQ